MRILLSGGTGFLGSHLLKALLGTNYDVVLLKRSFSDTWRIRDCLDQVTAYNSDQFAMDDIFKNHQIDIVVHCATNYGRKQVEPKELLSANLIFPLQLLQHAANCGTRCFINTDTILDKNVSHYSLSKNQFKEWLQQYSNELCCINISLEHFYGPKDDTSKFVTYIIRQLLEGVESINLTKGEQQRDFIYIDDVVDAFMRIIDSIGSRTGYFSYEIGTGNTISIRDFVTMVKMLTNNCSTQLNFGAIPYRNNEIMKAIVDVSALHKLQWVPKTSLEDGLKLTIQDEKETVRS